MPQGRGNRYSHVEELLCTLTGAEAALVVNNNAAAVLITMDALCSGGEVVVARGNLWKSEASFRIPDVMERSGATLREVGCTNRVHPQDYENAINEAHGRPHARPYVELPHRRLPCGRAR